MAFAFSFRCTRLLVDTQVKLLEVLDDFPKSMLALFLLFVMILVLCHHLKLNYRKHLHR